MITGTGEMGANNMKKVSILQTLWEQIVQGNDYTLDMALFPGSLPQYVIVDISQNVRHSLSDLFSKMGE